MTIQDLSKKIESYNPKADLKLINRAYDFAEAAHRGQKRLSGEDYIQHCLATASNLADIKVDDATLVAGLLHDVAEDTEVTLDEIRANFGDEVANLVDGITKLGKIKYRGIERYVENLRKMFVAVAKDLRIILIKFADRLHNLSTLDSLPLQKQQRIAKEVLEIYAPIANRLGVGHMKGLLEDIAFKYVYPESYKNIKAIMQSKIKEREAYLEKVKKMIKTYLKESKVDLVEIESRVKHLYSTYRKMMKKGDYSLDGIYDLVAIRIIVPDIADCYTTLGIIHQYWKPLKGRIKDYIAQPKPNNYRALHTTVFCEEGEIVEFQIRTLEMHQEAELGVAAHWKYDENGKKSKIATKDLNWLNDLVKVQTAVPEDTEYLEKLKLDFFQNRIFVFTPKGDVINLPEDSTPVDFAYHIHTDIGKRCSGVKINGNISQLDAKLKNGDMIEIIIEKNRKKPSSDWLTFVKTHAAKTRIKAQLRGEKYV